MRFNSLTFLAFLAVTFAFYWSIRPERIGLRNLFLLAVSYVFYGWWDYRFVSLIVISTVADYSIGRTLSRVEGPTRRKFLLAASLVTNLGLLATFKYFDFFVDSWILAWSRLGIQLEPSTLNLILPVGISFYTFQTLSYTIDVYRRKIPSESDFIAFAAFVAFFPQLVAGPIERASNLLPQFNSPRVFDRSVAESGIRLITWGLWKKIVIADNVGSHVNEIFGNYTNHNPTVLVIGTIYFGFQIYCDFSGYSDIARGTARLFGFELMQNFRLPYFSRGIKEFWSRWHISLSTWFRDYLYFPLGGNRRGPLRHVRNLILVFLISGLWHGANWTFVVWGSLHGGLIVLENLGANLSSSALSKNIGPFARSIARKSWSLFVMLAVFLGWVFFRSDSVHGAFTYLTRMLNFSDWSMLALLSDRPREIGFVFPEFFPLIGLLLLIEFWSRNRNDVADCFSGIPYWLMLGSLFVLGGFVNPEEFIYFQF